MSSNLIEKEVIGAFGLKGEILSEEQITDGHINLTYVIEIDDSGTVTKYLIQQINTYVFKNTDALMSNIQSVTAYLQKIISENGGDADRESLRVYKTTDDKPYYTDENGKVWRCYNFITDSHSLQSITDPQAFCESAKAFGKFQCMLADYPIDTLFETIPNFHNTKSRFADFKKALKDDISGRASNAKEETAFVLERESDCSILVDMLEKGELPLRVTHNDTKLNNVLFDNVSGEGVCVVDLDTVMPGLSLYDFGDSIRFGANTAAEDEKDVSKVSLSLEYFEAYTKGYLSSAGSSLTKKEIEYLPFSAKLMTLECGMRFLADYFNGDIYFKTEYPEHNLVRCRTQFALVADIEKKFPQMQAIVEKCFREYCK